MISNMRYTHLVSEAGRLLDELRSLGATFEDIERAKSLLEGSNHSAIGRVIHDLQAQIHRLQQENLNYDIDPYALTELEYED